VTAALDDVPSGVQSVRVDGFSNRGGRARVELRLVSGTPQKGIWTGHLRIARWRTGGTWSLGLHAKEFTTTETGFFGKQLRFKVPGRPSAW
jgi:hypothetical protein